MQDVEAIVKEGLSNEYLFNKIEKNEDYDELEDQEKLKLDPNRIKRKYVRRKGVVNPDRDLDANIKKRGRPPKSSKSIVIELDKQNLVDSNKKSEIVKIELNDDD